MRWPARPPLPRMYVPMLCIREYRLPSLPSFLSFFLLYPERRMASSFTMAQALCFTECGTTVRETVTDKRSRRWAAQVLSTIVYNIKPSCAKEMCYEWYDTVSHRRSSIAVFLLEAVLQLDWQRKNGRTGEPG